MTIYLIFKIAAVGILVSVLNQILKETGKSDYSTFVGLGGLVIVLYWIVPYIADLFTYIQQIFNM